MFRVTLLLTSILLFVGIAAAEDCVKCHSEVTPGAVQDWQLSKHAAEDVTCSTCHGENHSSAEDVANVELPTPQTCAVCHEDRVDQYMAGKHSLAWAALQAMPTVHWNPSELIEGGKGCGGCHKIGVKSDEEILALKEDGHVFGNASCDACHTRHTFSVEEARQPEACKTCHMGFDHPQWEMYSSSKHGVRNDLVQKGVLPEGTAAPTCQTCHMPDGNHEVRTAWGFLAVRLPLPEDSVWAADQVTILQALGVLDLEGNPTALLDVVVGADIARSTQEAFDVERNKMIEVCSDCHSENFAVGELEKGDQMIRQADHLMAEAIRTVAGLYQDGTIVKHDAYPMEFPLLLTFYDAPTSIEQKLHVMFLKHRMRTFQGTFHQSPDYALWYGWAEMKMDLTEINEMAEEMRHN
ncbi:MAG TPA: cytochrome C [Bacteroidetes bacterium]|nr:cytochrome C [Bacteroidota bacterium]HEX05010.1 cytochrome C [Bacteroidota bacterium]